MILIIINWILINVNVCCFLLVSSNKAADNCVFLKVINFIKMVGLKEGCTCKSLDPVYYNCAQ